MNQTIEQMRTQLPTALQAIKNIHLKESYLEFVLDIYAKMIQSYQFTAVDENDLCSSLDVEQRQEAQIEAYEGVFELFAKVFAACGEVTQKEITSVMAQIGKQDPKSFLQSISLLHQDSSGILLLPHIQSGDAKFTITEQEPSRGESKLQSKEAELSSPRLFQPKPRESVPSESQPVMSYSSSSSASSVAAPRNK